MADINKNPPENLSTSNETSFLSSNNQEQESSNAYGDFFQETSDGNISIGPKAKKSGIEVLTDVLGYVVSVAVISTILLSLHVFMRTREES